MRDCGAVPVASRRNAPTTVSPQIGKERGARALRSSHLRSQSQWIVYYIKPTLAFLTTGFAATYLQNLASGSSLSTTTFKKCIPPPGKEKSGGLSPPALHTYDPNRNGLCILSNRGQAVIQRLWQRFFFFSQRSTHFIECHILKLSDSLPGYPEFSSHLFKSHWFCPVKAKSCIYDAMLTFIEHAEQPI